MKIKKFPLILNPPPMPIVGFILQKDVYTTNLLYANDKFSTKSLRKKLPFRPPYIKNNDPNSCITILHNKKNNLNIKTEYTFKPKKLMHRRLKFPLPKMKTVPLNESILNGEICKQNIKIKFLEDDCNVTSAFGKKLFYKFKNSSNSISLGYKHKNNKNKINKENYSCSPMKTWANNKINYNSEFKFDKAHKRNKNNFNEQKSIFEIKKEICDINDELKGINIKEKQRKKLFFKKDFFSTQIYTKINMKDFNNNIDISS